MNNNVLLVSDCNLSSIKILLDRYNLNLHLTPEHEKIPGSYWGDSEAGIISNNVHVRPDTPIHSLLHETCHYICMDNERRINLDTNAGGDYDEENGVCYLQIILANDIPEMGKNRMMQDMDTWGYTFRLGSAEKWFNYDALDTIEWLNNHQMLVSKDKTNYSLRM